MKSRALRQALMSETIPPWVVLVDTETVDIGNGNQKLLLGCYEIWNVSPRTGIPRLERQFSQHYGHPYKRGHFTHEKQLYILLRSLKQCRCIAHNWQFDASVIRLGSKETRRQYGYSLDMERCSFPIDKGYTPFNVTITWGGDAWTQFLCNTNFHKTSLAKLGESFGITKLDMPKLSLNLFEEIELLNNPSLDQMDATIMEHFNLCGILKVLRYCRRDVEVLREAWFSLFRFSDSMAGCTPGITVASMAKRLYCRGWLPKLNRNNARIIGSLQYTHVAKAEETAYRGGRTDVFFEGRPKPGKIIKKYDVVSMYPSVMLERMPTEFLGPASPKELLHWLNGGGGKLYLAKVSVDIPQNGMGWLGWEGERATGMGLVFGCGKWTTWAWQPMLKIAFEQGWITEIHEVFKYRSVSMFRQYIEDIYALRAEAKKEGNGPRSLLLKYAMNTLYGKFGQGKFGSWEKLDPSSEDFHWQTKSRANTGWDRWQDFPNGDPTQEIQDYLLAEDGIYKYIKAEAGMGENSVCSVAGYVTSAARAKLWQALAILHKANSNIYMVDTDSIITDGTLPDSICGTGLGQWEIESESPSENCIFNAPKDYTFNNVAKCKGIREPLPEQRVYEQLKFSRWQTQLLSVRKDIRNQLESGAVVGAISKTVTGLNKKRRSRGPNQPNDPIVWDGRIP